MKLVRSLQKSISCLFVFFLRFLSFCKHSFNAKRPAFWGVCDYFTHIYADLQRYLQQTDASEQTSRAKKLHTKSQIMSGLAIFLAIFSLLLCQQEKRTILQHKF